MTLQATPRKSLKRRPRSNTKTASRKTGLVTGTGHATDVYRAGKRCAVGKSVFDFRVGRKSK